MTSLSDIPVVRLPVLDDGPSDTVLTPPSGIWSVELPSERRPSPVTLAALGVAAGVAAMVVGAAAVISATRAGGDAPAPPTATTAESKPSASVEERRVLALLAKPSTERVVFRGSGGRLVLAVGSGGRAAILIRGVERSPAGKPYGAWVVVSGRPLRAARFTGAERAVFLSAPVPRGARVVVATDRATALRRGPQQAVAVRA